MPSAPTVTPIAGRITASPFATSIPPCAAGLVSKTAASAAGGLLRIEDTKLTKTAPSVAMGDRQRLAFFAGIWMSWRLLALDAEPARRGARTFRLLHLLRQRGRQAGPSESDARLRDRGQGVELWLAADWKDPKTLQRQYRAERMTLVPGESRVGAVVVLELREAPEQSGERCVISAPRISAAPGPPTCLECPPVPSCGHSLCDASICSEDALKIVHQLFRLRERATARPRQATKF